MSDPFKITGPAVISFSGGRTSAYMLYRILEAHGGALPAHVVVIFTNTGKERAETLDFVERVSCRWGVPVTWLEYRRWLDDPGPAPGRWLAKPKKARADRTGLEVVDYATASRDGRPFRELIIGSAMLPNVTIRRCTQWLKIKTSWRYVRNVLGWQSYDNLLGLRFDEPTRNPQPQPKSTPGETPGVPLKRARVTVADVMAFWQDQRGGVPLRDWLELPPAERPGWDLELLPHEGNCDLCFLKGQGKLLEILRRHPEFAPWWIEMETIHKGKTRLFEAGRFRKNAPSYLRTLELSREPTLFDVPDEPDESVTCHCTD